MGCFLRPIDGHGGIRLDTGGEGMPHALAEELGRTPLSRSLAASILRAKDHAGAKGHRFVTLEHLLLALAEDEEAALVLAACNVDLNRLGADVAAHLAGLEREPPGGPAPVLAPEVKRIIEYAAAAAQQGRRNQVDGAIVLAAMVGEGRSMAAEFLRAQELTFEAVVHTLQQQAQARAAATAQNGAALPSTEEILANARERIAAGRGPIGRTPPAATRRVAEPEREKPQQPAARPALGDRAQPLPPVFADRDGFPPPTGTRGVAAGDRDEPSDSGPQTRKVDPEAAAMSGSEAHTEESPARTPPPLPARPPPDEEGSAPLRSEPRAADDQEPPPLPDWMRTRQIGPGHANSVGSLPPPIAHAEGALPLPPVGKRTPDRPPPALEPPRRPLAARLPRVEQAKPAVEPGQLIENIPRRMRVGVTETVEVRIGRAEADIAGGMGGGGPPVRHDVYITKAMSVRLRAPGGGFRIDAASPETQWTEATMGPLSSDYAVWRFSVTPEQRGEAVLQLVVAARVLGRDGIMAETALPEHVINVRVRANYVRSTLHVSGWLAALAAGGIIGRMGEDALAWALKLIATVGASI